MVKPYPEQPGMFDRLGQGIGGMFGSVGRATNPYSNRLMLAGMGMLSGKNSSEGWEGAMKGLVAGSAMDTERKRERALQGLMNDPDSNMLSRFSEKERAAITGDPELAREVFASSMKPADTSAAYDDYRIAQSQGYAGSFMDYQRELKPAGMSVNMGQEKAYDKTVGEGFGKDYLSIQQGARDASTTIGKLDRLGQALSAPGVYTGAGGEYVADLKKTASSLGIPVEGVENTDVARAISNEITMQLRNPAGGAGMPGSMSDADRQFLATIPPGLSNTPEGNRQKLDMLKKVQQRNIDVAQFANEYVRDPAHSQLDAGFYQALAQWAEANPLFPEGDTPSEMDALKRKYDLE